LIEYHVDTTDPNCPADIGDTWFASVAIPAADKTAPTVTVVPADVATNVAATANVVWTFSKAIDASTVTASNFMLLNASTGDIVAGTLSIDGTSKIVTLDPTASMTAGAAMIGIATTNVRDLAGNKLASNSITNFTVAA
ncbi:MAG: Ig-like domain-containing protein, partial [Lentisphaeria bacterium]